MVSREEITRTWLDVLEGRISREAGEQWAGPLRWTLPADQIAEEIGLQCLCDRGTEYHSTVEFSDEEATENGPRQRFDFWTQTCRQLDEGSVGNVWLREVREWDRTTHQWTWTGRFKGHWSASGARLILRTPDAMSIGAALEWARARADDIIVTIRGHVRYSAGPVGRSGCLEWSDDIDLAPVSEVASREEWRADYVAGTVRRWRVSLGNELPNHEPERSRFLVDLGAEEGVVRFLDGLPGPNTSVEIEVLAESEDEAVKIGVRSLSNVKASIRRDRGESGPFGLLVSVSAKPIDS
jgi:hypothetical protein